MNGVTKKPGVNLSGLDSLSLGGLLGGNKGAEKAAAAVPAAPSGKPLEILLTDIEEDPDQPRTEFSEDAMQEMTDSITAKGVKTPISIRPHPTKPGKWLLNNGARRYRASVRAKKTHIPAFVDDEHDDYDQVIVNIQSETHTPMELAQFISKRLSKGDKKVDIAKRLSKPAMFITRHLALLEMPDYIKVLYAGGLKAVDVLYELVKAHEKYPEQTAELVADNEMDLLTRANIRAFLEQLENPAAQDSLPGKSEAQESPAAPQGDSGSTSAAQVKADREAEEEDGQQQKPKEQKESDPDKLKKTIVQVQHDERAARLILDKRAAYGLAWIKYDDDGHEVEIDLKTAELVALVEGA